MSATREERLKVLADAAEELGLPEVAAALRGYVPELEREGDGTPRWTIPDGLCRRLTFHVEIHARRDTDSA